MNEEVEASTNLDSRIRKAIELLGIVQPDVPENLRDDPNACPEVVVERADILARLVRSLVMHELANVYRARIADLEKHRGQPLDLDWIIHNMKLKLYHVERGDDVG